MANIIDKKSFEQIFGHKFETLANTLINTTNKKENQIIVSNTNKNKKKLCEIDYFNNFVIQPSERRVDLVDDINLILKFNDRFRFDLKI